MEKTMDIKLTPELEQLVNEKIESGKYGSASEVIQHSLRLLKAYPALPENPYSTFKKRSQWDT